jgi:hypothetical protein
MRRTSDLLAITIFGVVSLCAAPAWGAFSAPGAGTSAVPVATLGAPESVRAVAVPGVTTVHVEWGPASTPAGAVDGYVIERIAGATATAACATSATALTAATSCDDANVAAGTYTYRVRAVFRSWTAATTSAPVTVTTDVDPPVLDVAFPTGGAFDAAAWNAGCVATICGNASDASGVASVQLSVRRGAGNYWDGAAFASASEVLLTATGTTAWSYAFGAANFPADDMYTVRVVATDVLGLTRSSSVIARFDTTPPVNGLALAPGATNAALSGSTLYYRGDGAGSFTLVDAVTDATSTPASATYPALAAAGWSHGQQTVTTPAGGPFPSAPFSWTAGASQPSPYTVTASDAAGNQSTAPITFADDHAAPKFLRLRIGPALNTTTSEYIRAGGQYYVYASVDDAGSGIASVTADVSLLGSGTTPATFTASTYEAFGYTFNYRSERLTAGANLPEGGTSAVVTVTDAVGNAATSRKAVTIDNTEPTVTFTFPSDDHHYSAAQWAAGCNPDGLCGDAAELGRWRSGVRDVRVWVKRERDNRWWNGTSWQSTVEPLSAVGTTSWSLALPAGALTDGAAYWVTAQAFDVAGNSSPATSVSFTYEG